MVKIYLTKFHVFVVCFCFIASAVMAVNKRLLRVVGDASYAPLSFINDKGEYEGFEVDLAKVLFEEAGYDYTIKLYEWNEALEDFENDSADVLLAVNYTEERAKKYAYIFSATYIYYNYFVLAGSPLKSEKDLSNRRIGTIKSYSSEEHLKSLKLSSKIVYANTVYETLKLLHEGKVDAILSDSISTNYYIKHFFTPKEFRSLPTSLAYYEQSLVVHPNDLKLLRDLNKAFFKIKENGQLDVLSKKWFGEKDYMIEHKILFWGLLLSAFVLLIILLFNLLLRRNVRLATARLRDSESELYRINKNLDKKIIELLEKDQVLSYAKEKAEESDRLKSLFLANMSHEIRTPLNAIVGFSDLLVTEEDEENRKMYTDLISVNSQALLSLISDILDISKIESGKYVFNMKPFDFAQSFNLLGDSLRLRLVNESVEFIVKNPLESCVIIGDKHKLFQVITNFVINAFKFTEKGSVLLSYEYKDHGLYVYTQDTGIGIKKENLSKIFERFYKEDTFSQGVGLGMAISKAIMESCKGKIGVESIYGKGSTFWFYYPCEIQEK